MIAALVTTEDYEDDYDVSYRQIECPQVNHQKSSQSKWNTQRRLQATQQPGCRALQWFAQATTASQLCVAAHDEVKL